MLLKQLVNFKVNENKQKLGANQREKKKEDFVLVSSYVDLEMINKVGAG